MALPSPVFQKPEDNPKQEEKKIFQPKFNHHKRQQNQNPEKFQQQKPFFKKKQWNFPCNYCNVGYDTQEELFAHRKTHEYCAFDGCKFNASAEVVAVHLQKVHCKREFFAKIQQLTTPEEIAKWREERRKRYPTTQNVILRQQAQEIRMQRGEKLKDKKSRFGDRNKLPRNNINHGKPNQKKKNVVKHKETNVPKVMEVEEVKAEESSEDEEPVRKIPKFTGTSKMKDYHTIETSIKQQSALSVLGFYGSDSEAGSDEEQAEELNKSEETNETENKIEESEVVMEESDNEPPDQAPIQHESPLELPEPSETKPTTTKHLNRRQRRQRSHEKRLKNLESSSGNPENSCNNPEVSETATKSSTTERAKTIMKRPAAPRIKKTVRPKNEFLEKLLREDIRHERNILLQCVNFVVKNNFFGVGQQTRQSVDSSLGNADNVESSSSTDLLVSKMDTSGSDSLNLKTDSDSLVLSSNLPDSVDEISKISNSDSKSQISVSDPIES